VYLSPDENPGTRLNMGNVVARALPTGTESQALLRLALPVVLVQVGVMAMGVVDTIMVGHLSATALAAVALGNLYFFGCAILGMGVLMALDPLVAQALGAGDHPAVARSVQRGLVLAVALSVPAAFALLYAESALRAMGQPTEVVPLAGAYARWTAPSVLPLYLFVVLRQSLQALRHMRPIIIGIVAGNIINGALNWMLIYGHLGAPALGVTGSAISTTIGRWALPFILLGLAWHELGPALRPLRPEALDLAPLWRMFRLGLPIGVQTALEFTAFGAVGLMMGRLGTIPVAAHQVAINLASLTFMVPLGMGQAAAVMVGHAIGAADQSGARRAARAAMVYGVGFMALTSIVFLLIPAQLAHLYTNDVATIALAAALLPVAGVFQLFDGAQAVTAGILRGAGDTRAPMLINLGGFWLFGIPLSLLLGFHTNMGPVGLWWGLAAALAIVAAILTLRVHTLLRRPITRVMIEQVPADLRA
jgi:multidrug resistance protein, MATE family